MADQIRSNGDITLNPNSGTGSVIIEPGSTLDATGVTKVGFGSEDANISAPGSNVTLTNSDARHQVFDPSTDIDVTLPTTSVTAGNAWIIENVSTTNKITIKSSSGSALDMANSGADGTILNGYAMLRTTQATPTLPGHWKIYDLLDIESVTITAGDWSGNTVPLVFERRMNSVSFQSEGIMTHGSQAGPDAASSVIPSRFRHGGNEVSGRYGLNEGGGEYYYWRIFGTAAGIPGNFRTRYQNSTGGALAKTTTIFPLQGNYRLW